MNLVLIGYRGTGKSTVAQLLAARLGCACVDTDHEIEQRASRTIAEIFRLDGEAAFRQQEADVIAEAVKRDGIVLSLGGGAVLRSDNRAALAHAGRTIWLKASTETILARLAQDVSTQTRRPPLTSAGEKAEVIQLLAQREPLYQTCADLEVDTDDRTPEEIVAEILDWLNPTPESTDRA
jgi:shikimate kinase